MKVRRVHTENGSHIEPPFDPDWPYLEQLEWHAAVVREDCPGLHVAVTSLRPERYWIPGTYNVQVGSSCIGPQSFNDVITFLTGVSIGWKERG